MKEIKKELIEKMKDELKNCKSVKDVYINEDGEVEIVTMRYSGNDADKCITRAQYDYLCSLAMHFSNATLRKLHKAVASNIINAIKNSGLERNQVRIVSC